MFCILFASQFYIIYYCRLGLKQSLSEDITVVFLKGSMDIYKGTLTGGRLQSYCWLSTLFLLVRIVGECSREQSLPERINSAFFCVFKIVQDHCNNNVSAQLSSLLGYSHILRLKYSNFTKGSFRLINFFPTRLRTTTPQITTKTIYSCL